MFIQSPANERKKRSIKIIKEKNIPFMDELPVITDDNEEVKIRSKKEIIERAIALHIVAIKGMSAEQEMVEESINIFGANDFFTPREKEFIKNEKPTEQEKINFSWQLEWFWVMLWALGYVEELDYPSCACDVSRAFDLFIENGPYEQFFNKSKLRDTNTILDQADLIYRYHWACVHCRLTWVETPSDLNPGVVAERLRALNWLINDLDAEWDDVSTDS